jgi:hypothetical protein
MADSDETSVKPRGQLFACDFTEEALRGFGEKRSPSPVGLCFVFKGTGYFGQLSVEMIQKHYSEQKWTLDRHLSWEDVELVISEMKRAQASASQQLAIEDNIPFDVVSCVGIMETEDVGKN